MIKRIIALVLTLISCHAPKSNMKEMKVEFTPLSAIPPENGKSTQFGLAGAVTGRCGDQLIVAGGANFEDNLPWRGGTKSYHDEIYVFTQTGNGTNNWRQSSQKLSQPMAYGALVPTAIGFLSIGGENLNGKLDNVYKIAINGDSINFEELPAIPVALSNAGAAIIGTKVFVAAGTDEMGATNYFMCLDLAVKDMKWELLPNLPETISFAVVVSQSDGKEDCIYVIGGRNKTGETSTFLGSIWKYSPSAKLWCKSGTLHLKNQGGFGLSAGTGVAFGDQWIILFGGDKGALFNRTEILNDKISKAEDGTTKENLLKEKDIHLSTHPGFSNEILAVSTITGEVQIVGEIPVESQVTTTAFWWNDQVIIPSGEIRPGVRTPLVNCAKFLLKQ